MSSPKARRAGRSSARFAIASFALLSTLAAGAYAQSKFAVIDSQRAMMETEDGLRMQATLKKLFESKQQELESKQADLQREQSDIEKQQGVISQDALRRRAEAWQREMVALQQKSVTYNQEMQQKQAELTQPIFEKTNQIIRRLATTEGYDMVVDRMAVAYVRSDLDLTDRVITLYNGGDLAPKEGSKKAPAAASEKKAAPAKK
jgi:outer membrane protein